MNAPDAEGNGLALQAVARNRPGAVQWPSNASRNGGRHPYGCRVPKEMIASLGGASGRAGTRGNPKRSPHYCSDTDFIGCFGEPRRSGCIAGALLARSIVNSQTWRSAPRHACNSKEKGRHRLWRPSISPETDQATFLRRPRAGAAACTGSASTVFRRRAPRPICLANCERAAA